MLLRNKKVWSRYRQCHCTLSFYGVVTMAQTRSECIIERFTAMHTHRVPTLCLLYDVSTIFIVFRIFMSRFYKAHHEASARILCTRIDELRLDTHTKYLIDFTKSFRPYRHKSRFCIKKLIKN